MTSKQLRGWTRAAALVSLALLSACKDEGERTDVLSPTSRAQVSLGVKVSDVNANVGDRVALAVEATSSTQLSGVQGRLRFDPNRLQFLGQIADNEAIVVINESAVARGEIRLAAISGTALTERVAKFAFKVRAPGYTTGVLFQPEVVGDLKQNELRASVSRDVGIDAALDVSADPVHWSYLDWAIFADPSLKDEAAAIKQNITGLPVAGTIYGDATLNGALNVLDASDVSNTAVGNREVIIGTTTVDRVTAGNVRPLPAGACPAGAAGTDCATRLINVLDASPIAQEALGNNQAVV